MTRALTTASLAALVACGGGSPTNGPSPISEEGLRAIARQNLQSAVAAEMRFWIDHGRFTADPADLDVTPRLFTEEPGPVSGAVSIEVCDGDRVVLLSTRALEGSVFAVKALGERPPSAGEAQFGHYTEVPRCDASRGPAAWPGGWHVSRSGLQQGVG